MNALKRMKSKGRRPQQASPKNLRSTSVRQILFSLNVPLIEDRDELADRYKQRIVEFMESAAEEPDQYLLPDEFKGGLKAQNEKMMMYGRERFKYTTNSKDVERIMVSINWKIWQLTNGATEQVLIYLNLDSRKY
jgi:hypothetical protein